MKVYGYLKMIGEAFFVKFNCDVRCLATQYPADIGDRAVRGSCSA